MMHETTKNKSLGLAEPQQTLLKKRQKQIDESKQMIADAMAVLLRERDFNDITLSQIADHAGVNRMTLYRHFKSKDKIILYLALKLLEKRQARIGVTDMPMKELLFQQLEQIKNLPYLVRLINSGEIEEILYELRMSFHKERLEEITGLYFEDDPYFFHFVLGGFNNIIREWLKNGCREPSRKLAEKIISLSRAFVEQRIVSGKSAEEERA